MYFIHATKHKYIPLEYVTQFLFALSQSVSIYPNFKRLIYNPFFCKLCLSCIFRARITDQHTKTKIIVHATTFSYFDNSPCSTCYAKQNQQGYIKALRALTTAFLDAVVFSELSSCKCYHENSSDRRQHFSTVLFIFSKTSNSFC